MWPGPPNSGFVGPIVIAMMRRMKIVKTVARSRPLQSLWRNLLKASVGSMRGQDGVASQSIWRKCHAICLEQLGFGSGAQVGDSGERSALIAIGRRLPSKPVIFDVGANVGSYTRMVLSLIPEARIFAFEPSPFTLKKFQENVGSRENVRVFNLGMSDKEGAAILHADAPGSGGASVYHRRLDHFGIEAGHEESIALTTLDGFCAAQGIEAIDFLKLDTEGHELAVLGGGKEMLSSGRVKAIQFEFGGANIDSRSFFQDFFYLLNPAYYLYRIRNDALMRIGAYRETDEVFVTTNYIALSRQHFKDVDADIILSE